MRRRLNPKRVTWASDVNLCQVRLFLSEESPSQVGIGAQDHLQAKASWPSQTSGITSDDNLPPGFEGAQASNLWKTKLAQIPLTKWEHPARFILEPNWRVVAGEESQEVEAQNQREMRVLEAIYPRPSAIPLNPSVPAEHYIHSDQHTPLIPITPIEEEDAADTFNDAVAANTNIVSQLIEAGAASSQSASNNLPVNGITATGGAPSLEPDVLAVAQAAVSAIMANDQGNLIDRELLMKILVDPQIIGNLVRDHGGGGGISSQSMPAATTPHSRPATNLPSMPAMSVHNMSMQNMSNMRPPGFGFSNSTPGPIGRLDPSSPHGNRTDLIAPSIPGTSTGPCNPPPPSRIGPIPNMRSHMPDVLSTSNSSVRSGPLPATSSASSSVGAQPKDINYYKSLIQQHGGERQDAVPPPFSSRSNHHVDSSVQEPPINNSRSRDSKPKIMKPCIYFNSARGCRHGVNCAYLHDAPSQQRVANLPEVQNAKRMKMDREITGT